MVNEDVVGIGSNPSKSVRDEELDSDEDDPVKVPEDIDKKL